MAHLFRLESCFLFCFEILMFEPYHQLEARILSSCFDVSTYPGEESLQALTKGDENSSFKASISHPTLVPGPQMFYLWDSPVRSIHFASMSHR